MRSSTRDDIFFIKVTLNQEVSFICSNLNFA
jgi:hypothetical protein